MSLAVGMALNYFLPGTGTAIGAMAQATSTAAASQFAGRVVANNGDFGHALKDMRSKQMMRSLIAAAATANFGGSSAPINSLDQFVEQLPAYLTKGMGTGALSAAIQKQNIIQGMTDGAIFGGASAVGNFGATNLGEAYNYGDGQIGYVQHKLGHMALGGALGAIISKDRLKGALIGGLSAGGAEIVAEALMGDVTAQVIDLKEAGFTDDQSKDHIMKLARFNGEFSKLAAASIAAASNNNVTTALFTASNAIENNFYHTDFFRRDITFGTETIGGPFGSSPQRSNRLAQQNKNAATNNGKPSNEVASNPFNNMAGDLATGFKGSKGFELKNPSFQKVRNKSTVINSREFSGHALDQMQNRGIMPSVVENILKTGIEFPTRPGTKGFYDSINNITVISNSKTGRIVTVIYERK